MSKAYSLPLAIVIAFVFFASERAGNPRDIESVDDFFIMGQTFGLLLGIPFVIWLPHATAGQFSDHWRNH